MRISFVPTGSPDRVGDAPRLEGRLIVDALAQDLIRLFSRGVHQRLAEDRFNELALRIFDHQYSTVPAFRAFASGRGVRPGGITSWTEVPAVPALAFRSLDLVAGARDRVERIFLTSGTTTGSHARGRHFVPRLDVYRSSLLSSFAAHVIPGGERPELLSLIPDPSLAPESSLSYMVGAAAEELCASVVWLVDAEGGLDASGFRAAAEAAQSTDTPVLVAATAFALVHLLDRSRADGWTVRLPEGTRIMETGGFKGRARAVDRLSLYRALGERLGVPAEGIVNEYGMTELLSQLYESGRSGEAWAGHVPPPWLRARALDPLTLETSPEGEDGLLCFFDLANVGSVAHVLTEDVGRVVAGRVFLRGRLPGAEPRGCSMAMDELMSAAERR